MSAGSDSLKYQIVVKGHIDPSWSDWLENLSVSHDAQGNTFLYGPVVDQAALHGILAKIRDLNLQLLSVTQIEEDV
jgi:hypothetical protein